MYEDDIDKALKLIREARELLDKSLSIKQRVFQQDDWETERLQDCIDHLCTVVEDLHGLPPTVGE